VHEHNAVQARALEGTVCIGRTLDWVVEPDDANVSVGVWERNPGIHQYLDPTLFQLASNDVRSGPVIVVPKDREGSEARADGSESFRQDIGVTRRETGKIAAEQQQIRLQRVQRLAHTRQVTRMSRWPGMKVGGEDKPERGQRRIAGEVYMLGAELEAALAAEQVCGTRGPATLGERSLQGEPCPAP
jgi:hypothetical protein